MKTLVFDIETDDLLDVCSKLHCIAIADADEPDVITTYADHPYADETLTAGLERLRTADRLVGHNIVSFDIPALRKLTGFTTEAELYDTLIVSRVLYPDALHRDMTRHRARRSVPPKDLWGRHSLKAWGYRLAVLKGTFGDQDKWHTLTEEMLDYVRTDVEVSTRLYGFMLDRGLPAECLQMEVLFRRLIDMQERNGVGFDEQKAADLYARWAGERDQLTASLQSHFPSKFEEMKSVQFYVGDDGNQYRRKKDAPRGVLLTDGPKRVKEIPFNPGSRKQIAERLYEACGWVSDQTTEVGLKKVKNNDLTLAEACKKHPKIDETTLAKCDHEAASVAVEYLALSKLIGMIAEGKNGWLKLVKNGRIHGRCDTCGTVTGRCSHSKPNLAQVPTRSDRGHLCRELFVPQCGRVLVGCDAEGLEARALAHFLAEWDGGSYGEMVRNGRKEDKTDIHNLTVKSVASLVTIDRDTAKTLLYAYMYGAGETKLGATVEPNLSERKQKTLGKKIKALMEAGITGLDRLIARVKLLHEEGTMTGLDGRPLRTRSEHSALNTLLQSAGALVMKKALCLFYERITAAGGHFCDGPEDWNYDATMNVILVLNVHDEVQFECDPEHAEYLGQAFANCIQHAGEHFQFRCPLAGAYDIGDNWSETH